MANKLKKIKYLSNGFILWPEIFRKNSTNQMGSNKPYSLGDNKKIQEIFYKSEKNF